MSKIKRINFKTTLIPEIHKYAARSSAFREKIKLEVKKAFLEARERFLRNFDNHPISKEIMAGPKSTNTSGTLRGTNSGNLFGFLGFQKADQHSNNPVKKLRKIIEKYSIKIYSRSGRTYTSIIIPSKEEIFEETPLEWVTKSWVRAIESGVSGLGSYIAYKKVKSKSGRSMRIVAFKSPVPSRSSAGIQVKSKMKGIRYFATRYMSSLLRDYKKDINKVKRGKIF